MYYFPTGNTDQKLPNKDKPKNKTKLPKKVVAQKVMCLLKKKKIDFLLATKHSF